MCLKGLPGEYRPFSIVVIQSEKQYTFQEFKVALRNFEENEKVMTNTSSENSNVFGLNDRKKPIVCFKCKTPGHKANNCNQTYAPKFIV